MKKKFYLIALCFLVLISASSLALTSNEAKEIALTYLEKNEIIELSPANSSVSEANNNYFVFIVSSSDNALISFLAIDQKTSLLTEVTSKNKSSFEKIFKTQYFTKTLLKIQSQGKNYLTTNELETMNNFKNEVSSQKAKLELIKTDSDLNSDLKSLIEEQIIQLTDFTDKADEVIELFEPIIEKQDTLLNSGKLEYNVCLDIKNKFGLLENTVSEMQDLKYEYGKSRDALQFKLFNSNLSDDKKLNYNTLVKVLSVDAIDNFKTKITAQSNAIKDAFGLTIPNSVYDDITSRIKKKNADNAINGLDTEFQEKTKFVSLTKAVEQIQKTNESTEYLNQNELTLLTNNYNKALSAITAKNYDDAIEFAESAKQNAVKVISSGIKQEETQELELWKIGLIIGIIILVIAIAFFLFLRKPKQEQAVQENPPMQKYTLP